MAKITLNVNLFPCSKELPSAPYIDLTENIHLARNLARTATQIFWLRTGAAKFSGYLDDSDEGFVFHLWHRGNLYRSFKFPDLRFGGVLHVDLVCPPREALGLDVLGELYREEATEAEVFRHLEAIITGPDTIPKLRASSERPTYWQGMKAAKAKVQRERIVARLLEYIEKGT